MTKSKSRWAVGVISDTHGLLRPEVRDLFDGVDVILHGGDIGSPDVLEGLASIAPVVAVRGNNDRDKWAVKIPETVVWQAGSVRVYVLHDLKALNFDPAAAGYRVVVSGHSHRPGVEERGAVLFLNPGSAGPRRFKLPISVGKLWIQGKSVTAEILSVA
jgi:uncharacterized protein